jgi:hypothetical protein
VNTEKALHHFPYSRFTINVCGQDALNRAKYNLIVAERIDPPKPARAYADRDQLENELKQVVLPSFAGLLSLSWRSGAEKSRIICQSGLVFRFWHCTSTVKQRHVT